MKQNSKYFDSIRISSANSAHSAAKPAKRVCQWKGCQDEGRHKAPMGRGQENKYYLFCAEHIRQYNSSYNYFAGMSDGEVEAFQKDAITGHRPTWKTGAHGAVPGATAADRFAAGLGKDRADRSDPHGFFAWRAKRMADPADEPARYVKPLERKSLEALHLPETATKGQIKMRFKELVKRHHPDANGGDKRSEDKLREIIQAYNYLKQAGLV
jgi:curved DNA-binding protein CbpA